MVLQKKLNKLAFPLLISAAALAMAEEKATLKDDSYLSNNMIKQYMRLASDKTNLNADEKRVVDSSKDMVKQFADAKGDFSVMLTPEQNKIISDVSSKMQQTARGLYEGKGDLGINNDDMEADRAAVMSALGLSDEKDRLVIFISMGMPEEMIQAYAREALWSGCS